MPEDLLGGDAQAPAPPAPAPVDPAVIRELQDLRSRNDYLQNSVQQMGGYLQSEAQQRAEAARAAEEYRISQLPPQDQANERVKLVQYENQQLRTWIAQAVQQRQAAPQVQDRNDVQLTPAQIAAKKQELVTVTNQRYGLSGDQAITLADVPDVYHDSQDRFTAKLAELGTTRKAAPASEADPMAKKTTPAAAPSGASRPMSPQANAPRRDVDRADFHQVLSREHKSRGEKVVPPSQRRASLEQLRAEAETRLSR